MLIFFICKRSLYINKEEEHEREFFGKNGRFLVSIRQRN